VARSPSGESVLERTIRVLEAFSANDSSLRVSDVARRANLPLSTASRQIAELIDHGLLTRGQDGQIRIGRRLWELASRASPLLSLREAVMPALEQVHARTGHHVQLGILAGHEVMFIERLSAENAVVNITRIAERLPLHASSSGLVLLAYGSSRLQDAVLSRPMHRYTRHTVTTADELTGLLAHIRRNGYVICPGFIHEDATGVAVPVRNLDRRVVAALSVIVPNDGNSHAHLPMLFAAARSLESKTVDFDLDSRDNI
jgi:DNA-binding IclR family transcriptional regulator